MELDIAIQIKNATLEDLQRLFGKQDISGIYPIQAVIAPGEDRREENLARSTIPSDELKSKKEVGNRYHQKWDIPFNSTTESAKYEMARKLCKRFNKPYPEALKLAGAVDTKKEQKTSPNKWQIPFSSRTQPHEYYLAWTLCRKYTLPYPEALKRQEEDKNGVIVQKAAEDVVERSENTKKGDAKQHPDSISPLQSDSNKITIASGKYVRQITPYKGSQIFGNAMVLSRNGDLVEVRNGNKKKHTVSIECLEIATSPKKPKVEEKSPISTLQEPESDIKGEPKSVTRQHLPAKSKKTLGKTMKCPYCDHVCETRGMHKHAKSRHPDQYDISGVTAYIKGKNIIPPLKDVVEPFPSPSETRAAAILSPFKSPVSEFPIGAHVRQVKPFLDRTTAGIGSVTAHVRGLIEVNWGGQKYYKIDPSCLEVV